MALTQISTEGIKNGTITGSDLATNIDLVDNQKIRLGTGNDLQIYHDGSHSHLVSSTGNLRILADGSGELVLTSKSGEEAIVCAQDGSVEIMHDNSKKFETLSSGIKVTGDASTGSIIQGDLRFKKAGEGTTRIQWRGDEGDILFTDTYKASFGTGADLQIYHDGTHTYIQESGAGALQIRGANLILDNADGSKRYIDCNDGGSVELYHDGSKNFETTSYGALVTGTLSAGSGNFDVTDNGKFKAGNSSDLQIFHDGTHSRIKNSTGDLFINSDTIIRLQSFTGSETMAKFFQNGAVELYFDNSKKFETKSTGAETLGGHNVVNDFSVGGELNMMQGTTNSNRFIDCSLADNQALFIRATKDGDANHEDMALFHRNLGVNLFFDNSEKFKTITNGINVTGGVYVGTTSATGLGSQTGASNVSTYNQSGITLTQYGVTAGFYYDRLNFTNSQYFIVNSSGTGVYLGNGSTSFTAHSDERLKQNITELDGTKAYNHLKNARAVSFKWKATGYPTDRKIGFIAQDWETNYPEVTNTTSETIDEVENPKGIQYTETIPVLMAALKQAISKIETLETEVAALKAG